MKCSICDLEFEGREKVTPYPASLGAANPLGLKQILSCPQCDFGIAIPAPSQEALDAFYSSGQYWEEHSENKLMEAHQRVQARVRLETCRDFLPTNRNVRVLDIGAGLGFLGDELSEWASRANESGVYYCAVEPDVSTVKRATERLRAQGLECHLVKSLDQAGNDFDVIFLNHVLEHVHDPAAFLKSVSDRLSESGILYVEVPHRDDRFKSDVFPHVLFFSVTALRRVAERAGLSVQLCEAFGATEGVERSPILKFGARVRRSVLGRIFNFAAQQNWKETFHWADRCLYCYKINPTGMWLRAALKEVREISPYSS